MNSAGQLRLDQAALGLWDQLHVVLRFEFWLLIFGERAVDELYTLFYLHTPVRK